MKTGRSWEHLYRAINRMSVNQLAQAIAADNRAQFHGDRKNGRPGSPNFCGAWKWQNMIGLPKAVLVAEAYTRARVNAGFKRHESPGGIRIDIDGTVHVVLDFETDETLPIDFNHAPSYP